MPSGSSGNEFAWYGLTDHGRDIAARPTPGASTMALSTEDLTEIDKVICVLQADAQVFAELRRRFPSLSWTWCDATDVAEEPFRSYPRFDVHLLDSADHCSHITADPTRATGVVLAKRSTPP
jgi:hypothetical protein